MDHRPSSTRPDFLPCLVSEEVEKEEMRENRCAGRWHSTPLALFCVACPPALRGYANPFDVPVLSSRACPRKAVGNATPHRLFCRRPLENNATEAEASSCETVRVNGTGCRAAALPAEGAQLVRRSARLFEKCAYLGKPRKFLRRCAPFSKMRTENCASSRGERGEHGRWGNAEARPGCRPARKPYLSVPASDRVNRAD